ncbi:hypothetical protein ACFFX1_21775 [Dactylosporangium sucinum]|uniref:DUF4386 family protein n=1 Tax=Dactylosporangium sucinum TaxID=1424081 RepID=A0A917UG30_9ACTN|nr:hypothetical protein [Dactylosporangium sucinum]GGM90413.1 hypothetical protein GCM10007977_110550 [Dactylosporangium sucinum]
MRTDIESPATATSPRKPLRDVRGFWRVLLAVVAPLPMLGMGIYYILNPAEGGAAFEETVAAYTAHKDLVGTIRYFGVPFLVGLIPATFAVAWVARRGAPRLTTVGACIALLGDLAGFPLIRGSDELAYYTVNNGFDVTTMAKLQNATDNDPLGLIAGLLFIVGIVIGLLLLGLALWRSGAAPAWMGIALAAGGFTHPFMPGHLAAGIGLLVAAVGFAGASVALLRMHNDDFDLAPARFTPGL